MWHRCWNSERVEMAASNPPTHENSREGPGRDDHVHITTLLGQV